MALTYVHVIILLICSNTFMTFAWYAHLKNWNHSALWIAILMSWSLALFEYIFQVPANRLGFNQGISLAQLKILQEAISVTVFVPFALFYMRQPLTWNFLWAGLCILGAIYFIFR